MRYLVLLSVACLTGLLAPSSSTGNASADKPPAKGDDQAPRSLDIGYSFVPSWRLMAPALAQDLFGPARQLKPILYRGKMVPRGMVVLRCPGSAKDTPKELLRTLRGKDCDITTCIQIIGAQHRSGPRAVTTWVPAEKLPVIKVRYAPEMPAEITFPGSQDCVLLYEIGQGREDEWAEGYWSVSLRFDARPLGVRLDRQDTISVSDPARTDRTSVICQVEFDARGVRTKADEENLLYYTYQDRLRSGDTRTRMTAEEPLGKLLEAYPVHGELLLQRANLQAEAKQYAEAVATAKKIVAYAREGTLHPWPVAPLGERMSHEEVLKYLQSTVEMWEQKAKEQPIEKQDGGK